MYFKYFLFESLLLAGVKAGPLKKDSRFHYQRQDGTPQNNSSTTASIQSQTSSAILSDSVTTASVLPTEAPQASAANSFDQPSPSPSQYTTDSVVVIPIKHSETASASHRPSLDAQMGSSVSSPPPASQTTQSSSSQGATGSQTIVVSFTPPFSQQAATSSSSAPGNTTIPLLTASGIELSSTLSGDALSTTVLGSTQIDDQTTTAPGISSTPSPVAQFSKTSSSAETLPPAGVESATTSSVAGFMTASPVAESTTPAASSVAGSSTTSSPLTSSTTASTTIATSNTPNGNNIPTAIINSSPPATGTVSPAVYAANLAQANSLNAAFANLTTNDACTEGQYACIDAEYAGCTSAGEWFISGCGLDEVCAVMPLNTTSGVQIGCFVESKVVSVLGAVSGHSSSVESSTGASNSFESSSTTALSSETTTASADGDKGNVGVVTVTVPSSTAYLTVQPSSSNDATASSSKASVVNGGNAVTVTVPASTAYTTVQPSSSEDATTSSSKSNIDNGGKVVAFTTSSASPSETPAPAVYSPPSTNVEPQAASTTDPTKTSTTPLPTSSTANLGDPFAVIPVKHHSTTTMTSSQAAVSPIVIDQGNGHDAATTTSAAGFGVGGEEVSGGTSTSTSVDGYTTSIFITVTAVATLVVKETVTVGIVTATVSV